MVRSKGILVIGLAVTITGILINYFSGKEGLVNLQVGKSNKLYISGTADSTTNHDKVDLNLILSLDSLIIHPHIPGYEIELMHKDTGMVKEVPAFAKPSTVICGRYPLEPMKIRKIGKTKLRFRLKEFYPDFTFKYSYPEKRDTIKAIAPGILMELKTKEGPQIVTLRSDKKGPSKLGDIVGLGASFAFYWDLPPDSMMTPLQNDKALSNTIIFSGLYQKVYLQLNGMLQEKTLKEQTYYEIPGPDSVGFKILYCVPDVAYLNASPATKSQEAINPVANVEVWELGGAAKQAFIYPESNVRKGGEYWIPDSDYMLNLAISQKDKVKFCDCTISVRNQDGSIIQSLDLQKGHSKSFHNYKFTPIVCDSGSPDRMVIKVTHHPGNKLALIGVIISAMAIGLIFINKKK